MRGADGRASGRAGNVARGVAVGWGIWEAAIKEFRSCDDGDCCVVEVGAIAGSDYGRCFIESVIVRRCGWARAWWRK